MQKQCAILTDEFIFAQNAYFWTFPQFSTKPVDKIVDFLILDKLF